MIFIERYPLKRCQGCVKLIASKVNCFLNINDLSEVQLCMSSNSWTWECPHTKDGADHVPLIFSSVYSSLPWKTRNLYVVSSLTHYVHFVTNIQTYVRALLENNILPFLRNDTTSDGVWYTKLLLCNTVNNIFILFENGILYSMVDRVDCGENPDLFQA